MLAALIGAVVVAVPPTGAAAVRLPAAGPVIVRTVVARTAPSTGARKVLVLHDFRRDFRPQIVFAVRLREIMEQEELALELVERATAKLLAEKVESARL